jgi:hypothetical protein
MDHEIAEACAVVSEAVGFVKNPSQEDFCHAVSFPSKSGETAEIIVILSWVRFGAIGTD